jgi:hypothetical protein
MTCTVKQITTDDLDLVLLRFIADNADRLNNLYGGRFDWYNGFPLKHAVENHVVLVAYQDEEPVGVMFAYLGDCMFDMNKTVLRQELLFAKSPRVTVALLRYFIDFGKLRANYVIACIGKHTNFKTTSLEKLGFTKLEELYIMEV